MSLPWIIRLEEEIKTFEDTINKKCATELKAVKKHRLDALLKTAVIHKQYDIYHSTTIEGYKITPEEVSAVIAGKTDRKKSGKDLKDKMAILGHAYAFEYIIDKIKKDFGCPHVFEELLAQIYFQLFRPSVEAGIIHGFDLLGFRNVKVYIHNSRYVPPASDKVPALMQAFFTKINQIKNNLIKAILAHYFLVTIHPYVDGNGRCGRLLMNYILSAGGYSWVTITIDKRDIYFQCLQDGQLNNNILPFAKFILEFLLFNQPPATWTFLQIPAKR